MSSSVSNVRDLLTCPVCIEQYDNFSKTPKLLPCHHSFCLQCIKHLLENKHQLSCPTCRKPVAEVTSDTRDPANELQTNFYIIQMVDLLNDTGLSPTKSCKKHNQKLLMHFCKSCGISICNDCLSVDHRDGQGHSTQTQEEALTEQRGLLSSDLLEAQTRIANNKLSLAEVQTELGCLQASKDFALQEIEMTFSCYMEALTLRKENMVQQLRHLYSERRDELVSKIDELRRNTQTLSGLVDQSDHLLHSTLLVDLLAYREKLATKTECTDNADIELNNFVKFTAESSQEPLLNKIQSLGTLTCNQPLPAAVQYKGLSTAVACLHSTFSIQLLDREGNNLSMYPIDVRITDAYDGSIPCRVTQDKGTGYAVMVRPRISGQHKVWVVFLGQIISHSVECFTVRSNDPVMKFGKSGDDAEGMEFPRAVASDHNNNIYVVDTGNFRIKKYDTSGEMVQSFPIGLRHNKISSCGIAIDTTQNRIYVPEVAMHEAELGESSAVLVYNLKGELLTEFSHDTLLCKGWSLAINSIGHCIVADNELGCVFVFDKRGQLLNRFPVHQTLVEKSSRPTFICVQENDNIVVSDSENARIQIFDKECSFVRSIDGNKAGRWDGGFGLPFGVAADNHGNILIVDGKLKRIQIYKTRGDHVGCIESLSDPLSAPRGIAVTNDGYVVVADRDNHCVKKYKYLQCTQI